MLLRLSGILNFILLSVLISIATYTDNNSIVNVNRCGYYLVLMLLHTQLGTRGAKNEAGYIERVDPVLL